MIDSNKFIWPLFVGDMETIKNDDNIISYHLMKDGIYCKRKVFKDKFIFYKDNAVADLISAKEDLHPIKDIKIPAYLLHKTIEFFKYVLEHFKSGMEAYVLYAIDVDGNYFLHVPPQTVTAAHVSYDISDFHKEYPGCYIIADAHSHSTFGAFWSGTDTNDDCRGRYSVVIGQNKQIFPEIKCRFNYSDKFVDLKVEDMFEENNKYVDLEYDWEELVKNLSKSEPVTTVVTRDHDYSGITRGKSLGSNYFDYSDWYFRDNDKRGFSENFGSRADKEDDSIARCTGCGKFSKKSKLEDFEGELLCQKCAVRLGAFHVCY